MSNSYDLAMRKKSGGSRDASENLVGSPNSIPPLAGQENEKYVISVQPKGYAKPCEVTLSFPMPDIDPETQSVFPDPSAKDFEQELDAFNRLLPSLLTTHANRFVAIRGGQVVDEDSDEIELARRVDLQYRREFVLIRFVSSSPVREDRLESPEVEYQ